MGLQPGVLAGAVVLLGLLLAVAHLGADAEHYVAWARAFRAGDLFALPSLTGSPLGLPVTIWAPGTGLVFALGDLVLGSVLEIHRSAIGTGWLAVALFWWAFLRLLALVAPGRPALVLFGAASAFVGTHAGYYTTVQGSESLSLACLATLAVWVLTPRRWRPLDGLVVGVLGGLLVLIRPQLALYAAVGGAVMADAVYREDGGPSTRRLAAILMPALLPAVAAAVAIALVDRWMTGSLVHLPWRFGGEGFRSFDFSVAKLGAVLAHPWHGLLVYHPLYAVAFGSLCLRVLGAGVSRRERALAAALVVVVLVHLYVQASWFCWWLGLGAFGMRGMAVASVVLVPALVRVMAAASGPRAAWGWLVVALGACVWSYPLLWLGESNFVTTGELWRAQAIGLRLQLVPLLTALAVGLALALLDRRPDGPVLAAGSGLASLAVVYLVQRAWGPVASPAAQAALVALGMVAAYWAVGSGSGARRPSVAVERAIAVVLVLGFGISTVLFARLALRTEAFLARKSRGNGRAFRFVGTVPLDEIDQAYAEYLRVPGFEAEKAALARFLAEARGDS